ncbi:MAG: hypothetical protein N2D54_11150 [Chloroflexota bacterium]
MAKNKINNLKQPWGLGLIFGVLYAVIGYYIFFLIDDNDRFLFLLSNSFLWGIPLGLSALVAFLAPLESRGDLKYGVWQSALAVLMFFGIVLLLTFGVLICFVVFLPIMVMGAMIGGILFSSVVKFIDNRKTFMSMILIPVLIAPYLTAAIETRSTPPTSIRTVHSSVVIETTADIVWENIIEVREITPEEQPFSWLQLLGIPRPVEASMDGTGLNATRFGHFSNGLVFTENITDWQPGVKINFDILTSDLGDLPSPIDQIGGRYFQVMDATYKIEPMADGNIRLHLSSTHRLTTHVNGYISWWTDLIMEDFQDYLLEIIKVRVENVWVQG